MGAFTQLAPLLAWLMPYCRCFSLLRPFSQLHHPTHHSAISPKASSDHGDCNGVHLVSPEDFFTFAPFALLLLPQLRENSVRSL